MSEEFKLDRPSIKSLLVPELDGMLGDDEPAPPCGTDLDTHAQATGKSACCRESAVRKSLAAARVGTAVMDAPCSAPIYR